MWRRIYFIFSVLPGTSPELFISKFKWYEDVIILFAQSQEIIRNLFV